MEFTFAKPWKKKKKQRVHFDNLNSKRNDEHMEKWIRLPNITIQLINELFENGKRHKLEPNRKKNKYEMANIEHVKENIKLLHAIFAIPRFARNM